MTTPTSQSQSPSQSPMSASDFIALCVGSAAPASEAPARDLDIYVNVRSTRLELCLSDNTTLDAQGKPTKTRFYSAKSWPKGPAEMETLARTVVARYRFGEQGRNLMLADISAGKWEAARPDSEVKSRRTGTADLDALAALF